MCVICLKPAGVSLPSPDDIKAMFNANPDGAGIMLARGGVVSWRKGFMDYKSFTAALADVDDVENTTLAMHFRITTSGGTRPGACHPFPIAREGLERLEGTASACLMHNGVFDSVKPSKTESDTMVYTSRIVAPLMELARPDSLVDDMCDGAAGEIIANTCGSSRVLLMFANGDTVRFGKWYKLGGCLVSNLNFQAINDTWTKYGSWWTSYGDDSSGLPTFEACDVCDLVIDCYNEGRCCNSEFEALSVVDEQARFESKD